VPRGWTSHPGVHGGTVVTFEVWSDGVHPGSVAPFVQSTDFAFHAISGATVSLPLHGWKRITWTVPQVSVLGIGLEIHTVGDGLVLTSSPP
jgi:hypothetical protein